MPEMNPVQNQRPTPDVERPSGDPDVYLEQALKYATVAGPYEEPIKKCVTDLDQAIALQHESADKLKMLTDYQAANLDDVVAEARRDAAVKGVQPDVVERDIRQSRLRERTGSVRKDFAKRAAALAATCRQDLTDLKGQLDRERAKVGWDEMPGAGGTEDLATYLALTRYGDQCKSKGIAATLDHYQSQCVTREIGGKATLVETQDAKLTRRACSHWIRDLLAEDPKRRRMRLTQGGTVERRVDEVLAKENRTARALLAEFERQEELGTPPVLLLAIDIFGSLLVPAYRLVVGAHAWDLGPSAWSASLADQGRLPDPLDVLDEWYIRHLPYGRADQQQLSPLALVRRGGVSGPPSWNPNVRRKPLTSNQAGNPPKAPARVK